MRNLFNLNKRHEMYTVLMSAYKALARRVGSFLYRDREVLVKTNGKGDRYLELQGYLTAKFRLYEPDHEGKSRLMVLVDDLFAAAGERDGKTIYENPIIWGRVQTTKSMGMTMFFFNDGSPREAVAEFKKTLVDEGVVDQAALTKLEEAELIRRTAQRVDRSPFRPAEPLPPPPAFKETTSEEGK